MSPEMAEAVERVAQHQLVSPSAVMRQAANHYLRALGALPAQDAQRAAN
jgi:hypothetical protein